MLPVLLLSLVSAPLIRLLITRKRWITAELLFTGAVLVGMPLQFTEARIGEDRHRLERRLLDDRTAIRYPQEVHEQKFRHRDVFYRNILQILPEGSQHQFYYKRADGSKASQGDLRSDLFPEGWDLHVIYFRDRVVFECYRRNGGEGLTEFELNALLALNKGNSYWQEAKEQDPQPSAFRYQWILEDGSARAMRRGRMLVIINSQFDARIKQDLDIAEATREDRQAAEAPDSVAGF